MPFDERCEDLAGMVLDPLHLATTENVNRVAQAIQDTIDYEIRRLELARDEENINANSGIRRGKL